MAIIKSSNSTFLNVDNKPLDGILKTAWELGIEDLVAKILAKNKNLTLEIKNISNQAGTIDLLFIIVFPWKTFSKEIKITNFKNQKMQDTEDIKVYLEKIPDKLVTKHNDQLAYFFENVDISENALGINLPTNSKNFQITRKIKLLHSSGKLDVEIEVKTAEAKDQKNVTIIGFKTFEAQDLEKLLTIKKYFDQLGVKKTKLSNKTIESFELSQYSSDQLGFKDEPTDLLGVIIDSYTVKAIDMSNFLLIEVRLKNIWTSQVAHFKLNGFANQFEKTITEFNKIVAYLQTFNATNAFNLQQKNFSDRSWSYIWELIIEKMIEEKHFDKTIIRKIMWCPLKGNDEELQSKMLDEEFNQEKKPISKIFKIWIDGLKDSKKITIFFKNFLTDQNLIDQILANWQRDNQQRLVLNLASKSSWKNKTFEEFQDNYKLTQYGLMNWKEVSELQLEKDPFVAFSNVQVVLKFSSCFFSNNTCAFYIHIYKNKSASDGNDMVKIGTFKST